MKKKNVFGLMLAMLLIAITITLTGCDSTSERASKVAADQVAAQKAIELKEISNVDVYSITMTYADSACTKMVYYIYANSEIEVRSLIETSYSMPWVENIIDIDIKPINIINKDIAYIKKKSIPIRKANSPQ